MGDFPFYLLSAVGSWQKSLKSVSIFFANGKSFEIKLEIEIELEIKVVVKCKS